MRTSERSPSRPDQRRGRPAAKTQVAAASPEAAARKNPSRIGLSGTIPQALAGAPVTQQTSASKQRNAAATPRGTASSRPARVPSTGQQPSTSRRNSSGIRARSPRTIEAGRASARRAWRRESRATHVFARHNSERLLTEKWKRRGSWSVPLWPCGVDEGGSCRGWVGGIDGRSGGPLRVAGGCRGEARRTGCPSSTGVPSTYATECPALNKPAGAAVMIRLGLEPAALLLTALLRGHGSIAHWVHRRRLRRSGRCSSNR